MTSVISLSILMDNLLTGMPQWRQNKGNGTRKLIRSFLNISDIFCIHAEMTVVPPNTFCLELTGLRGMVFVEQELCKRPSKPSVTDNLQLYRL